MATEPPCPPIDVFGNIYTRHGEKIERIKLILKAKERDARPWAFKKLEEIKKRGKEEVAECVKQAEEEYKRRKSLTPIS